MGRGKDRFNGWQVISPLAGVLWLLLACGPLQAVEHVAFQRDGNARHVTGQLVVEAEDGGLLVRDTEGVLWAIQPKEISERSKDDKPFKPLDRAALAKRLQAQLPAGFRIHSTAHYLICYNTSRPYAQWCGALYERLYSAFHNYWKRNGFELRPADGPLVALVFDGPRTYSTYAREELGDATSSIIGYFSLRTNRVTMYDLTQADRLRGGRATTAAHVNRILMRPDAERTVATIIHEATHQLAFNCGLHARYADIPLWVSEGSAVYFETPDLKSSRGWRGIGAVNRHRFNQFRRYTANRSPGSLRTLLANDDRFRQARTAGDAYAEAWAVNYYLLQRRSKQYVKYLHQLAKKQPLLYDTPQQRIDAFEQAFGQSLEQFDADFLRYIRRVR